MLLFKDYVTETCTRQTYLIEIEIFDKVEV
jgi:hypothetical protein